MLALHTVAHGSLTPALLCRRGTLHTLTTVAREEGVRSLWKGLVPGLHRQVLLGGVRIASCEASEGRRAGVQWMGTCSSWRRGVFAGAVVQSWKAMCPLAWLMSAATSCGSVVMFRTCRLRKACLHMPDRLCPMPLLPLLGDAVACTAGCMQMIPSETFTGG